MADSCCEFPKEYKADSRFQIVPLELMVEDEVIIDDETFNQESFLRCL
ncbi:MAG: DegV family protein [Lachnospiraceae bacterium]|nr:DegV family protein [Lachnospiraceae bacterium]